MTPQQRQYIITEQKIDKMLVLQAQVHHHLQAHIITACRVVLLLELAQQPMSKKAQTQAVV